MADNEFVIHKVKYDEEWRYPSTKDWMVKSWNALRRHREAIAFDYQQFEPRNIVQLEELIAVNVFGVSPEFAERVLKMNSILKPLSEDQRRLATGICRKMVQIAGSTTVIMQAVPIFALMEDSIGKQNPPSACFVVFRVKTNDGGFKFLDCQLRIYDNWNHYLTTNRIPPCMLCYPNDGFVRATEDMNGNTCGDIRFGEPPSCTFKERVVETLDKIAPVVTVLLEFIPTGVPVAQALRTISCSAIGYCAARKGMDIYDKATHGEEYVTDLVHFATTISVLAARRMIPRYLRSVALQKRSLTFWESTIISGVLRGLSVTAAVILAMLVHRISLKRLRESKPITAQDVMDLLVAAFDFHSCFMSPKTAEAMLKEALRDISVKEILNSVPGKTAIIEPYSDGRITDQVDLGKAETIEMTKDNQECEAMVETPKNEPGGQVLELQEKISPMEEEMRNLKSSHSVCETQFKKREQKMVVETSEGDIFNKSSQAYRSCKELEMEQVLGRIRDRLEMIKNHEETILNTKEKLKSAAVSDEAAGRRIMHTSAIDIDNLANEVLRMQHEYLEKIECDMEDEVAQKTYRDFVDKETNNCDRRRRIDQNNRIIETVTVMDAEKVFKLVSLTKSQICFANGESLDLLVNNQFEVSPRVMDQMDRSAVMVEKVENSAGPETEVFKNDLEEAMRLTQQFDANQLDRSTYLDRIHRVLQKYKMSIRGEDAAAASQQLQRAASSLPKESQKMFENMAPCLASSTKITLQGTPPVCLKAAVEIAKSQNVGSDPTAVADCVEVVKLHFGKKKTAVQRKRNEINARPDGVEKMKELNNVYREEFDLSETDLKFVNNTYVSEKDKDDLLRQRFAEIVLNDKGKRDEILRDIEEKEKKIRESAREAAIPYGSMLSAYCHLEKDNAEVIPASDKKQTSSKAPGRSEESNASEMNELQEDEGSTLHRTNLPQPTSFAGEEHQDMDF